MLWTVDKFALCSNSYSGKLCTMLQLMLWTSMHYAIIHALENYVLYCNSGSGQVYVHSIAIHALYSGQVCTMQQFMLWKIIHYAAIHALYKYVLCSNSCSWEVALCSISGSELVCTMLQLMLWTIMHYAAILSCYSPTVGSQTPYTVLTPAVRTNCGD